MEMLPVDSSPFPVAAGVLPEGSGQSSDTAGIKWAALHDAAQVVAALAGVMDQPMEGQLRDFPELIRAAGGWRREQAELAIDDLCAIMEPGLSALLAVHSRGSDATAAALALWQEFDRARHALLALLPPAADE